jgi:hypothetical protein
VSRAVLSLGAATLAAVALVAVYLALGGASFAPAGVADPCAPRTLRTGGGLDATLFQVVISTADGAACSLGVSREEVVLALAGETDLAELAREHDISTHEAEEAVRQGLLRAVKDAQDSGRLGGGTAATLRFAAEHLPMSFVLALLRGASSLLPG